MPARNGWRSSAPSSAQRAQRKSTGGGFAKMRASVCTIDGPDGVLDALVIAGGRAADGQRRVHLDLVVPHVDILGGTRRCEASARFDKDSVGLRERRTERVRAWPRQHDAWCSGHQMSWSSALCTMYVLSPVGAMRALLPHESDMLGVAGVPWCRGMPRVRVRGFDERR